MTKKEMIVDILTDMGLRPHEDQDGDIEVRYQMKQIYFFTNDNEENYLCIKLPYIYHIEEGQDMAALIAVNSMTRETKMVKVYIENDHKYISTSAGFYFADAASLRLNIENALNIFSVTRSYLHSTIRDIMD